MGLRFLGQLTPASILTSREATAGVPSSQAREVWHRQRVRLNLGSTNQLVRGGKRLTDAIFQVA